MLINADFTRFDHVLNTKGKLSYTFDHVSGNILDCDEIIDGWYASLGGVSGASEPLSQNHIDVIKSSTEKKNDFLQFITNSKQTFEIKQFIPLKGLRGRNVVFSALLNNGFTPIFGHKLVQIPIAGYKFNESDGGTTYTYFSGVKYKLALCLMEGIEALYLEFHVSVSANVRLYALKLEVRDSRFDQTLAYKDYSNNWVLYEHQDYFCEKYRYMLENGQIGINDNLLVNACFAIKDRIVNQNGYKKYTPGSPPSTGAEADTLYNITYGIDMWYLSRGDIACEIVDGGLHLTCADSPAGGIAQYVEGIPDGSVLTFSILTKDGELAWRSFTYFGAKDASENNTRACDTKTSSESMWVGIYKMPNNMLRMLITSFDANLLAAKLEFGDRQTLAHLEKGKWVPNKMQNYTEELLKAQRYRVIYRYPNTVNFTNSTFIAVGFALTATKARFSIVTPVSLRAKPYAVSYGMYIRSSVGRIKVNNNGIMVLWEPNSNKVDVEATCDVANFTVGETLFLESYKNSLFRLDAYN